MEQTKDNSQGEKVIGRLIAAAGPGAAADAITRQRVYAAVRERWDETVRQRAEAAARRRVTRLRLIGLAATVAAAAVTVLLLRQPSTRFVEPVTLADVTQALGNAVVVRDDRRLAIGEPDSVKTIASGDTLRTGPDGKVALALADGLSLRVNVNSELVFTGTDHLDLTNGTIYLDSGMNNTAAGLEVGTPLGTVEHVGTQYEVRFGDAALRVRVREGAVAFVDTAGQKLIGDTGQQLVVGRDGQAVVTEVAASDPGWDWAENLAVLAPSDKYILSDVGAWAARELGLTLQYANAQAESRWAAATLPDLAGFNPEEALSTIRLTTTAVWNISDGRLLIEN